MFKKKLYLLITLALLCVVQVGAVYADDNPPSTPNTPTITSYTMPMRLDCENLKGEAKNMLMKKICVPQRLQRIPFIVIVAVRHYGYQILDQEKLDFICRLHLLWEQ